MLGTLTRGTVEGLGQVCCHLKLEGRYLRNIYMELLPVETQLPKQMSKLLGQQKGKILKYMGTFIRRYSEKATLT